jgi:Protein of unknown function (DUF1200).
MGKTKKVFRSRISILFIVFLLAIYIPICFGLYKNKVYDGFFTMSGIALFAIFLGFRGMRYIISENILHLNWWFITIKDVDITHIESVKRTYDPISAPASSVKRLLIKYKGLSSTSMISPVKEKEFISELKVINPDIEVNVPIKKGIWRFWDWDV